ncbi:hypothetical protein TsFJ059_000442 [Trichoderma semiorbis]|uniref:Uncharacterized protein n=1 Tax=Trichoderma semiorbis TaxID=1491008 RepID=A0A9P8KYU0_9HYPO|nr:hypothetical protein TsFJ059_000442 [Trichoderma semiorbis]
MQPCTTHCIVSQLLRVLCTGQPARTAAARMERPFAFTDGHGMVPLRAFCQLSASNSALEMLHKDELRSYGCLGEAARCCHTASTPCHCIAYGTSTPSWPGEQDCRNAPTLRKSTGTLGAQQGRPVRLTITPRHALAGT